ncbi:MAG: radical SAM protein [Candidatus Fermentibacteraceae bacterium]
MKVLLIQSPTGRRETPIYPLGLAFLSSHLKASGHECRGIDLSLSLNCREDLRQLLRTYSPETAAVSLRNIDDSSWPVTWSYLDAFKEIMEELSDFSGSVIVGGPGFSIYAERILSLWPRIDFGIAGEGELVFPELIGAIGKGDPPPGRLLTPAKPSTDELLNPDYTLFPVADYPGKGAIGVQSRRGCPFGCRYCTYGHIGGTVWRNRPVNAVAADVAELGRLGVKTFMFVDSVFDHPVPFARELTRAVGESRAGLEWGAWLSDGVPPDFLTLLWENGCRWVDFSPDAITKRGLRLLGKPVNGCSLYSVVRNARRAGLSVGVNFFNGNPGEGFPALLHKLFFMIRARVFLGFRSTFVNIGTIRIYPGSPMARDLPPTTDLLEPVFHAPRGLSAVFFRFFTWIRRKRHR